LNFIYYNFKFGKLFFSGSIVFSIIGLIIGGSIDACIGNARYEREKKAQEAESHRRWVQDSNARYRKKQEELAKKAQEERDKKAQNELGTIIYFGKDKWKK